MNKWFRKLTPLIAILSLNTHAATSSPHVVEHNVDATFSDISIDIENAIYNKGFVVDFKANIGEMPARTAADVGSTKTVYENAVTWQFCSALLSREMVEISASNIAYCPYVIFAYETTENPGTIVVGFLQNSTDNMDTETNAVMSRVDDHLQAIVTEATE